MLATVKSYIETLPAEDFSAFYQDYICRVQDQNVLSEIGSINVAEVLSLSKLIEQLRAIR